jgi:hypothetical protein
MLNNKQLFKNFCKCLKPNKKTKIILQPFKRSSYKVEKTKNKLFLAEKIKNLFKQFWGEEDVL